MTPRGRAAFAPPCAGNGRSSSVTAMVEQAIFGDEAGTTQFNAKASKYFILTTATLADCAVADPLLALRRQLAWEGVETHPEFHACEELQPVRDRVLDAMETLDFRIDATVFEKRKAMPRIRQTEAYFYQFAWFYHLKYLVTYQMGHTADLRLLVVPATLAGRGKKQEAFSNAVRSVVSQVAWLADARCVFWSARTDPCLWLADYASWAIQRKYEHTWQGQPDTRSYDRIKAKIRTEFNIFAGGKVYYY